MDIKNTANLVINFTIKRVAEIFGIIIFTSGILLLLSLLTYSPEDPNFIFPDNKEINNTMPDKKIATPNISASLLKKKLSNKLEVFLISIYSNQYNHFVSSNFCC